MTRVLVVDDDAAIRETMRIVLEDMDYTVEEASDGEQALTLLHANPEPAVVLLDLMMPRLDGSAVLRLVAEDAALRRNVFLLVTANAQTLSTNFLALLTRLSVEVLRKPFDIDVLLDTVERASLRLPDDPYRTKSGDTDPHLFEPEGWIQRHN